MLYSILDDVDYTDGLVENDNDLTDEPDNDYHTYDYDVKEGVNVSVRNKWGYLHDAISTGKELFVARGAIKDFVFNLIGPIVKGLNKDSNTHALKGFTRRVLS